MPELALGVVLLDLLGKRNSFWPAALQFDNVDAGIDRPAPVIPAAKPSKRLLLLGKIHWVTNWPP